MTRRNLFPAMMLLGFLMLTALMLPVIFGFGVWGGDSALNTSIGQYNEANQLKNEVQLLRGKAADTQLTLDALDAQLKGCARQAQQLSVDLNNAEMAACGKQLTGPGLVVRLADTPRKRIEQSGPYYDINWFLVHDRDMLMVVNILKAAGAEAVAINGVRLQAGTAIHCSGPAIYVRDISLTPPFEIAAIGDSAALSDALLKGNGGDPTEIYQELTAFGIIFEIEKKDEIMIPSDNTTDAAENASHS